MGLAIPFKMIAQILVLDTRACAYTSVVETVRCVEALANAL